MNQKFGFFSSGGQSGSSLIDMILAVAMASIVTLIGQSLLLITNANSKNLKNRADAAQIRNNIVRNLDCAATLAAMGGVCPEGDYIDLLSGLSSKPKLIAKPKKAGHGALQFDQIGIYSLAATCEKCESGCPNGHKIMVSYAAIDPVNSKKMKPIYIKDPLTGKPMDWTSGADLFDGIPIACEVPF